MKTNMRRENVITQNPKAAGRSLITCPNTFSNSRCAPRACSGMGFSESTRSAFQRSALSRHVQKPHENEARGSGKAEGAAYGPRQQKEKEDGEGEKAASLSRPVAAYTARRPGQNQ